MQHMMYGNTRDIDTADSETARQLDFPNLGLSEIRNSTYSQNSYMLELENERRGEENTKRHLKGGHRHLMITTEVQGTTASYI